MGALRMLAAKEEAFLPREDGVAGLQAEEIAELVADDGRRHQRQRQHPDVEVGVAERIARGRRDAGDEKHGVARQEEADEQAGFRKDHERDERDAPLVDQRLEMAAVMKVLDELEEGVHAAWPGTRER